MALTRKTGGFTLVEVAIEAIAVLALFAYSPRLQDLMRETIDEAAGVIGIGGTSRSTATR
jgi:Tfp pilus assembly protein PilE